MIARYMLVLRQCLRHEEEKDYGEKGVFMLSPNRAHRQDV